MLLKLHGLCTVALLVFAPDSPCLSHEEAPYFAAVAKFAAMLLEVLDAYANMSKKSASGGATDRWDDTNGQNDALFSV